MHLVVKLQQRRYEQTSLPVCHHHRITLVFVPWDDQSFELDHHTDAVNFSRPAATKRVWMVGNSTECGKALYGVLCLRWVLRTRYELQVAVS